MMPTESYDNRSLDPTTISFIPGSELERAELEAEDLEISREEESRMYNETVNSSLASHFLNQFTIYRDARRNSGMEEEIQSSGRAYNGEYDPEDLSRIMQNGGSTIFMNLTATKSRAAQSWIRDILVAANQDAFSLTKTPLPELPEEITKRIEEAFNTEFETKAAEMRGPEGQPAPVEASQSTIIEENQKKRDIKEAILDEINLQASFELKMLELQIKDQLEEGGWRDALSSFIEDFCVYPAAFMKGPVITKKNKLKWVNGEVEVVQDFCFLNKRINPIDVYPSPSANTLQDGGLIEHVRFSHSEVDALKRLPDKAGYDRVRIQQVLEEGPAKSFWFDSGIEYEKAVDEKRGNQYEADLGIYHGLHCWDKVPCRDLKDWGLKDPVLDKEYDETKLFEVEAILINNEVVKVTLNKDPLLRRPYYKASFQHIPGSFWGRSLPSLMRSEQRMCNATARELANNMALSSGPQCEVYIDRLADQGEDLSEMRPRDIHQVISDPQGGGGRAINFFVVPSIAQELLAVYDKFEQKSDDATGIPKYSYGNERVGGAAQALANYEKVITPDGRVSISSLKEGDKISNTYSTTSSVLGVYPQGECDIFRLKFSNEEYIDCDMNHRWSVRTHNDRPFRTLTTEEILDKGLYRHTKKDKKNPKGYRPKWMLPNTKSTYFNTKKISIDPYTMGILIGDGDSRARVTSMDQEVFDRIPYPLGKKDEKKGNKAWTQTVLGVKKDLTKYLGGADCYNKFIPKDYLENSIEVRKELLKGLMDSDGCISKNGESFYFTTSELLATDFKLLIQSLGGSVKKIQKSKDKRENRVDGYRVHFYTPFPPAALDRKNINWKERKLRNIYITGIEYIGKEEATCITVDSKDSLFLTDKFIPTHNTASGLSMLLESATKSIKDAIRHIDEGLIRPRVMYQFFWNMKRNPENKYTGDINVMVHGSDTLTMKGAQQMKRQEFLQITANEMDQKLMGPEGRAELIRELAKDLNLNTQIVPSRLELKQLMKKREEEQAQMQQQQAQKDSYGVEVAKLQGEYALAIKDRDTEIEALKEENKKQAKLIDARIKVQEFDEKRADRDSKQLIEAGKDQTKRDLQSQNLAFQAVKDEV